MPTYTVDTTNGNILKDGTRIHIRGINWFGAETAGGVVERMDIASFTATVNRMKQLGFNAVRLPFSHDTLTGFTTGTINSTLNPQLVGKNSLQCYDYTVQALSDAGLYVLLDFHLTDKNSSITRTVFTLPFEEASVNAEGNPKPAIPHFTKAQWLADLNFVANRYKNIPNVIGLDLKNEPHGDKYVAGFGILADGTSGATWGMGLPTDWNTHAEEAGSNVLAIAPNWLIFVEGVQENNSQSNYAFHSTPDYHTQGGNLEPFDFAPIDPTKIPKNKLVLAPHEYGPDVFASALSYSPLPPMFTAGANFPNNLPAMWETHFGYLKQRGYAVVIGEYGGFYGRYRPEEKVWEDNFVQWLISKGMTDTFYWCWNPSSQDTGGVIENDWNGSLAPGAASALEPWTDKIALLQSLWAGGDATYTPTITTTPVTPAASPASPTPIAGTKVLMIRAGTNGGTSTFSSNSSTNTYTFAGAVRTIEAVNNAANYATIVAWSSSAYNHEYELIVSPTAWRVVKVDYTSSYFDTQLGYGTDAEVITPLKSWYSFSISHNATTGVNTVRVNGKLILSFTDSTPLPPGKAVIKSYSSESELDAFTGLFTENFESSTPGNVSVGTAFSGSSADYLDNGLGSAAIRIVNAGLASDIQCSSISSALLTVISAPFTSSVVYSVDTSNGNLLQNGVRFRVKGINWFGAETSARIVERLDLVGISSSIAIMKSIGVNAVRLPFSPDTLNNTGSVGYINPALNPGLGNKKALEMFDEVINQITTAGIKVLLDFHHVNAYTGITKNYYTDASEIATGYPVFTKQNWIDALIFCAIRYRSNPGVMGIDLKNEPHGQGDNPGATWGFGKVSDWNTAAEDAGAEVLAIAPHWLIFVEGIQENADAEFPNGKNQSGTGYGFRQYGESFEGQNYVPINHNKIPKNRLVFSPHSYGPDVITGNSIPYFNDASFPANMPAVWEQKFGFLKQQGFAVVVGEFGGYYGRRSAKDKIWQDAFVAWLKTKGMEDSFYWCWNPSSGDTGGLIEDDWTSLTLVQAKVTLLQGLWNQVEVPPAASIGPLTNAQVDTYINQDSWKYALRLRNLLLAVYESTPETATAVINAQIDALLTSDLKTFELRLRAKLKK